MNKLALVIGGTGFVGTAVVEELGKVGWEVAALSRGQTASRLGDQVRLIEADRNNPEQFAETLAGETFDLVVDCGVKKRLDAEAAVRALLGRAGHYVWISTTSVYSPFQQSFPINEDGTKFPSLAYAAGKLECEEVLQAAWRESGFAATALRPPYIDGAGRNIGPDPCYGRSAELLRVMSKGEVVLLAEGMLLIQPVWNREIGRCIAHIAGDEKTFGEVFNLSGATQVTIRQYYMLIAEKLGVELRFESKSISSFCEEFPNKICDAISHRVFDLSKLTRVTGFEPTLGLAESICENVDWQLQRGRLSDLSLGRV